MNTIILESQKLKAKLVIQEDTLISLHLNGELFAEIDISEEYDKIFAHGRVLDPIEILAALITIKDDLKWEKQPNFSPRIVTAYILKHEIEIQKFYQKTCRMLGGWRSWLYCGNLIVAMLLLGFEMKKSQSNTYAHVFNLQKKYALRQTKYKYVGIRKPFRVIV